MGLRGESQITRTAVISQPFLFDVEMYCTELVLFVTFYFPKQKIYPPRCLISCERSQQTPH